MLTYDYTARDPVSGRRMKATVQADSEQSAAKLIRAEGLVPIDITVSKSGAGGIFARFNRVRSKDRVLFSRQLSTLLNAGLPLVQSLRNVNNQTESKPLKVIIARPRPDIVPHLVDVRDLSFPSGHAMLSAVTYLTLGALLARMQTTRATRLFMIAAALFLTLIIGLSRIFLGVHYPTDVLGGWCAGATWAVGCALVARSLVSAKPEPQPAHPNMDDSLANG